MKPIRIALEIRHLTLLAVLAALSFFPLGRALALDPAKSIFQFNCRNWTRQNGLPTDKVNAVTQTKDGYLWLGTQNGLVRFDGGEFKVIPIDLPTAQGQDVLALAKFRDGTIRFAINAGGFAGYNGHAFFPVTDGQLSQTGLDAHAILEATDGTTWVGSVSGLGRWSLAKLDGTFSTGFTNTDNILSLCEDGAGRIWAGTAEHGLLCWDGQKVVPSSDDSLARLNISALTADKTNQIWVGTSMGLLCYTNGQVQKVPGLGCEVRTLLIDRHGILWVGTSTMGLARYQNGKFDFLTKADGLGSDYVTSLFEDAEGSLWVGTRDGLSQLSDLKFPIYTSKEGLAEGSSHSVAASRSGGLWISSDNGLSYFTGTTVTNSTIELLRNNSYVKLCFEARNGNVYFEDVDKTINILSDGRLLGRLTNSSWTSALTEDAEGMIVACGSGDCLFRIQDGKLTHYRYKSGLTPDYYWINNLCVAKDGAIWVASKNGLYRLEAGDVKRWSTTEGLSGDNGLWIFEDSDGTIWAGLASGIVRIKNGQVKNIRPEDGLADNWIYAIVPDDYGFFWCSSSRGIFRVSRKDLNDFADGQIRHINSELFNGPEAVKSIGRTDQEYSGCKTIDGRIWFPCPWGVVMVDPAHVPANRVVPPVHIDQVIVNGRRFSPGENIVVPPGQNQLEFHFAGLSFVAPEKIQFRYQLNGYDQDWVNTDDRHQAFYTNVKPGRYTFRVTAANADGLWNPAFDSVKIELRPYFYQTIGFYFLCGGGGLALLVGIYVLRIRHLEFRQRVLQESRDQLEVEVRDRTNDLAKANGSLQHEVEEHRRTGAQLVKRTQLLEQEVAERERMQTEIESTHRRLLEISRQAGMAEVATNVLHNVGNVLNSANVSATVVADNARKSRLSSVGKVAALLNEHADDLGAYLTSDPKGRRLPGYLTKLAGHLASEQLNAISELDLLRQNIDHIKEIVAMQQSYANASGVSEIINASELVDVALQMTFGAGAQGEFELVREFENLPPLTVDKHKLLQILVNLIRNAKHACDDSGRKDKQLQVKMSKADDSVQITIIDNGVGIPAANMARIFNHGFTTRKKGHGFGLHSGALAARELGGSLTVHSDGKGKGAAFTLTLPLQPPKAG